METEKLTIKALDYKFYKLYRPDSVDSYKKDITDNGILGDFKNIELDITFCRLGYPSTPRFIDLFLAHLAHQKGDKKLTIKMGCISYSEWVCLNIIVLEGLFFDIKNKMNSENDLVVVKELINKKLTEANIKLTICLDNDDNTTFVYGG